MPGVDQLPQLSSDEEHRLLGHVDRVVADAFERAGDEHHEHRPLAKLDVVPDVDRPPKDPAVEAIDPGVLEGEVFGELDVTLRRSPSPVLICRPTSRPMSCIAASISSSRGGS